MILLSLRGSQWTELEVAEELQGRVVPEAYDLTRMNLEATLPDHRDDVREVPKQGHLREYAQSQGTL